MAQYLAQEKHTCLLHNVKNINNPFLIYLIGFAFLLTVSLHYDFCFRIMQDQK